LKLLATVTEAPTDNLMEIQLSVRNDGTGTASQMTVVARMSLELKMVTNTRYCTVQTGSGRQVRAVISQPVHPLDCVELFPFSVDRGEYFGVFGLNLFVTLHMLDHEPAHFHQRFLRNSLFHNGRPVEISQSDRVPDNIFP
jgi:hypothetical protein